MKVKATFELTPEAKRKLAMMKADLRLKEGLPVTEAAIVEALIQKGSVSVDAIKAAIRALDKALD